MNLKDPLYRYSEIVLEDGSVILTRDVYTVRKVTPCGVRVALHSTPDYLVESGYVKTRFVNLSTVKKFAHPTEEDALKSFVARKRRQIAILEFNTRMAYKALLLAEGKVIEL